VSEDLPPDVESALEEARRAAVVDWTGQVRALFARTAREFAVIARRPEAQFFPVDDRETSRQGALDMNTAVSLFVESAQAMAEGRDEDSRYYMRRARRYLKRAGGEGPGPDDED
jgi:hypothetical protein